MEIKNSAQSDWTIRKVSEPTRGPVTKTTVRELAKEKSLRQVAKIAEKYAK